MSDQVSKKIPPIFNKSRHLLCLMLAAILSAFADRSALKLAS
jgi:hypothetical protein